GGLSNDEMSMSGNELRSHYLRLITNDIAQDIAPPQWDRANSEMSLSTFLKLRGASDGALSILRRGLLDSFGDGIESLSYWFLRRELSALRNNSDYKAIIGGNDRLPTAIASELRDTNILNTWATIIAVSRAGQITVHSSGKVQTSHDARALICAIPTSQLRKIRFLPALDLPHRGAIDRLRQTSICRVFL